MSGIIDAKIVQLVVLVNHYRWRGSEAPMAYESSSTITLARCCLRV